MGITPTLEHDGLYKIINVSSGTLLTLNDDDGKTITGERDSNYDNQMWLAEKVDNFWCLKCLYEYHGSSVWLSYDGPARDGAEVVGDKAPHHFVIAQEGTHWGAEYRMWVDDDRKFLLDLSHGSHEDHTKILVFESEDSGNQFWVFQKIPKPN
ncbi:hypothetical protein C0995_009044 [Termitomyces sp. Mi166|nr:hypothetical protein C0995_009044 [Termitomyces sp. Mi166\